MNASASGGRSSARIFGRRGRRAVRFAVSPACLASALAGSLPASGDTVFEPFAGPFLAASLSTARSPVLTAFLLALAAAAALLFALWRRAEAARSRERLAKDMRFRSLLEETNEGVVSEAGGQLVYSNPAFRRLFQRHEGELLGKPLHLLFAPESRERLMEVRTALLDADPVPESYEAVAMTPGGARFDVEIRAAMVSFEGREAMQMTFRDITRRKRAEVRLRRSEERYRSLFERSLAGVYRSDLAGKLLDCNDAFARILGFTSREEALGVPLTHHDFDPGDRARLTARLLAEKSLTNIEVRLRRKDGEPVWVLKNEALARADDGSHSVLEGTIVDITERKRAGEDLHRSEEKYRDLVEGSEALICLHDLEGRLLAINPAAARGLGDEPASLVGRNIREFLPEKTWAAFDQYLEKIRTAGAAEGYMAVLTGQGEKRIWHYHNSLSAEGAAGPVVRGMAIDVTDQRRAEEALRRSEERYRLLFERNLAGVYSATTEGRLIECNEAFAQMMGYATPEDAVAGSADTSHPFREEREDFLARLQAEGSLVNFESRARRRDGSPIWILENVTIIPAEGERPDVLQGTALDITERKRAEEEARLLLETALAIGDAADFDSALSVTLRRICEATGWVLGQAWIPRADGSVLECSPARYIAAGARLERFRDLSETFVFPPGVGLPGRAWSSRRPAWIQDVGDDTNFPRAPGAREAGLRAGMGIPVLAGDAVVAVLEFFVLEQRAEDTHLVRLISAVAEQLGSTIHRKRAEQALRESEEKYRDIFEFAPIGIYQARPDGSLLTANAMLAAMLGHTAVDDLRERNLKDLYFDPPERDALFSGFERHEAARSLALRWKRKDGRAIWVELDAHALKDEEGRVRYYEGFVHDITQRKRAEDEKRNLQEQLAQSQKIEAVGQLAGGIAHDFNNLLTAIGGYSELLLAELPPGDPRRSHAEEVRRAGDRAASLTRQLLAYSRRQVLEPRVLDLNAIVLDLEKILRRLIGEQIQLRTRPFDGLWPVKADPGQIEQAILNLAINARDAMPDGGTLTIETANVEHGAEDVLSHASALPGSYAMVAVSDTGIGMNEEVKARIFEPFFTTKEQGKGTGLGLSTTYGIVKQSGGHILCDSEPGRGATFRLYLPRVQEVIEKASPPPAIPSPRTGEETILLVEDEPEVRSLVERVLKMQGYTVLVAANAAEALRVSQRFRGEIAIMVSDVVMPGISGKQLADRLAASRPETKVLFMSGYTVDAIVHHGILDPGVAFLQKPFTPQALSRKVREVLDAAPEEFKVS